MIEPRDPVHEYSGLWRTGRPNLAAFVKSTGELSTRQLTRLVAIDQRERWRLGEYVTIEEYFQTYPQLRTDTDVALDLVYGEYLLQEEHDDSSNELDLGRRFPELAPTLHAQIELHRALSAPESSVPDDTLSGRFGRYEIQRQLGRGGMGTVYLARDTQLNRLVALKVPLLQGDARRERQFLREAQAVAALQHPNICPVFDCGQIDGRHYLTMAYLEGETLASRLHRGALPSDEAIRLVRTIADALEEAHRAGIIHRDLKPANILFDKKGRPFVADFGLSRNLALASTDSTSNQSIVGTPAYMAPEQINGDTQAIGPATDVYALGVLLYEALTGKRPFAGALGTLLGRIATEDPEKPSHWRPEIDARLDAFCLKALAKKPEQRWASMAAFAAALGQLHDLTPAIVAASRGRRTHVTRRLALAGAITALAIGSVFLVRSLRNDRSDSPGTPPAPPGPSVVAAPHEQIRLLVPAYFKPSGPGLPHWNALVCTASSSMIVIINAADGPGAMVNAALSGMIERLQTAGAKAIGYVGTDYGKTSLEKVKRDVDAWFRLYPTMDGIFFEEQSGSAEHADYYIEAARRARSKNAKALIVSNPGDHCARVYFDCPDIDIICVLEAGKDYRLELPEWMRRDFPHKLAGMLYDIDSARRMEQRLAELIGGGVRTIFLSDTKENEHFSRLPPWWNKLVHSAAKPGAPNSTDERSVAVAQDLADKAWVLNDSDQMDRALEECNKALALDDKCVTALMCRASAQIKKRQFDPAIADLNRAACLEPENEMPHVDLAWAKNEIGEYDQAMRHANDAIALKSDSAEAFNQRGWSYFNQRKYREAVDDFTTAIKHDPNFVNAYEHRSSAYAQLGMNELAEKDSKKAEEIRANAKKK